MAFQLKSGEISRFLVALKSVEAREQGTEAAIARYANPWARCVLAASDIGGPKRFC